MPNSSIQENFVRILPESLINKIAAGEVVERPSSVVKELLENSIDAGATEIQVTIKNGGKDLISIIDNGCGMNESSAKLSFERHATSKIKKEDDLFNINTLGFRGEALAAIASVSYFELLTSDNQNQSGTKIFIKGGKLEQVGKIGFPRGTKVTVEKLFYNTPARQKFLKTTATEFQHIQQHLIQKSLSNPKINFRLTHNKQILLNLSGSKDLQTRIDQLFGTDFSNILMSVRHEETYLKFEGFISFPSSPRTSRRWQYTFVNGRNVKSLTINHGIYDGYGTFLGKNQHPVFFINIIVDPSEIDVNVHPAKTEIRFRNSHLVHTILVDQISRSLKDGASLKFFGHDHSESKKYNVGLSGQMELPVNSFKIVSGENIDKKFSGEKIIKNDYEFLQHRISNNLIKKQKKRFIKNSNADSEKNIISNLSFTKDLDEVFQTVEIRKIYNLSPFPSSPKKITVLGQSNERHIIAEDSEGLMFFNLKMFFERIIYEIYFNALRKEEVIVNHFNSPILVQLSEQETIILNQSLKDMNTAGFSIRVFGKNTFSVYSCPEIISENKVENLLREFLGSINFLKENVFGEKIKEICYVVASNVELNSSDKLSLSELDFLLAKWEEIGKPMNALSKKAMIVKFSNQELKNLFK